MSADDKELAHTSPCLLIRPNLSLPPLDAQLRLNWHVWLTSKEITSLQH